METDEPTFEALLDALDSPGPLYANPAVQQVLNPRRPELTLVRGGEGGSQPETVIESTGRS